MNEIVEIDGMMVRLSPMMAWAYHEDRDWKKYASDKLKAISDEEEPTKP